METYSFPLKWHDMSPLTDSTKYTVHIKSADSAGCVTLIWRWDQNLQGQRPSSAVLGSTVEPLAEDERECRLCRFFNTSEQWRRGTGELLTWMFWSLRGFQSSQDQSSVLCKTFIVTFFFFLNTNFNLHWNKSCNSAHPSFWSTSAPASRGCILSIMERQRLRLGSHYTRNSALILWSAAVCLIRTTNYFILSVSFFFFFFSTDIQCRFDSAVWR